MQNSFLKVILILLFVSCSETSIEPVDENTVTDINGNVYKTIQIGEQLWMAENLKVTHYRNGEAIPKIEDGTEWVQLDHGAYAVYSNLDSNISSYGLLYNFYAIEDTRGIAPEGWHIPTDEEWKQLEIYLGMSRTSVDSTGRRGEKYGGKLKDEGFEFWHSPNSGATNEVGFSALPGGYRYGRHGAFFYEGLRAHFWSSTESSDGFFGYFRLLEYSLSTIDRNGFDKHYGLSIRCIKD